MLRDEVTDGAEKSINHASSKTIGVVIAGMPKRFPGTPLVLALDERDGHIAVLDGVVVGMAWN